MGDWFDRLFGFKECRSHHGSAQDYEEVRKKFNLEAIKNPSNPDEELLTLTSMCDKSKRQFIAGRFETPSLADLRRRFDLTSSDMDPFKGNLVVEEVIGDVSAFHIDPDNAFALFQAASQFNCLEHTSQSGLPEHGITCYSGDHTQGPACATACAPGTVVRNYFAFGEDGQTATRQVENLKDIEDLLANHENKYFQVKSGYTLATNSSLNLLTRRLQDAALREEIISKLRIGIHCDTEVTGSGFGGRKYAGELQLVTQAYCSAISVSYSRCSSASWEAFAKIILLSAYESTMYAALDNAMRHRDKPGARRVYLTALGGGVFGNPMSWIEEAMSSAFAKFKDMDFHVYLVSYGGSEPAFQRLAKSYAQCT